MKERNRGIQAKLAFFALWRECLDSAIEALKDQIADEEWYAARKRQGERRLAAKGLGPRPKPPRKKKKR
jgi:hypothetical protein